MAATGLVALPLKHRDCYSFAMATRFASIIFSLILGMATSCGDSEGLPRVPSDSANSVDLSLRLGPYGIDPDSTAAAMLRSGWLPETEVGETSWHAASEEVASFWIPHVGREVPTSLELIARSPYFLPYEFELTVSLNGTEIHKGTLGKKEVSLKLPFPAGRVHRGWNLVELKSSHVLSPKSVGFDSDLREHGVEMRGARFLAASGISKTASELRGASLSIVVPLEGRLLGSIGPNTASLFIQDSATGSVLSEVRVTGSFDFDLSQEEGRDIMVSLWSETVRESELSMEGGWRPSNVIVIVCDTLRLDAVLMVKTPNLNRILEEGVGFSNAFSHAPMTLPSHTAMFSSRLPHHSGVVNNGMRVPESVLLLAEWMRDLGYSTHAVASLGTLWNSRVGSSLDRGFQTFEYGSLGVTPGLETASIVSRRLDAIEGENPFFLFAHFADPHDPYRDFDIAPILGGLYIDGQFEQEFNMAIAPIMKLERELSAGPHKIELRASGSVPIVVRSLHVRSAENPDVWIPNIVVEGKIASPSDRLVATIELPEATRIALEVWPADHLEGPENLPRYLKEIGQVDLAIGTLVDDLKARGLWEESLVIFTSDHGEEFGDHGHIGHVETLYNELLRVPLVIKLPNSDTNRTVWTELEERLASQYETQFRQLDLVPTLLDLLQLSPMPGATGHSVLDGRERPLFAETHAPEAAHDLYAMRDDEYKLIFRPDTDSFEMYEASDGNERNNIYERDGALRKAWQAELRRVASAWALHGAVPVDEAERARLVALGYL